MRKTPKRLLVVPVALLAACGGSSGDDVTIRTDDPQPHFSGTTTTPGRVAADETGTRDAAAASMSRTPRAPRDAPQ